MKEKPHEINAVFDEIETMCDAAGAQVTITRANGVWIGMVRTADGRSVQYQSPFDQQQLFIDVLDSLERMTLQHDTAGDIT